MSVSVCVRVHPMSVKVFKKISCSSLLGNTTSLANGDIRLGLRFGIGLKQKNKSYKMINFCTRIEPSMLDAIACGLSSSSTSSPLR